MSMVFGQNRFRCSPEIYGYGHRDERASEVNNNEVWLLIDRVRDWWKRATGTASPCLL